VCLKTLATAGVCNFQRRVNEVELLSSTFFVSISSSACSPANNRSFQIGENTTTPFLGENQMASFLRFPQVRIRVGLSRSTIYLKILHGEFPKPINLGARAVAWVESDIDAWMTEQVQRHKNPLSIETSKPTSHERRGE
jgi:prophage regulatory protein